MCPTRTTTKQTELAGDWWLSGLVALSLLLGGWLLGYGLSPWIGDSTTLPTIKSSSGKYSTAVPVWRQDWNASNGRPRTKNSESGN